jgi:hypothetical protein
MELLSHISQVVRETPAMASLFNWNEISKLTLPDAFIIEHSDNLNWDVMCKYQTFSMDIVEKYDYIISTKLHILVTNVNLAPDVLKHYASKMDWESAQRHLKFTPELLEHFREGLDMIIVLQHQVMSEEFILEMLDTIMEKKQWAVLRKYLTLVFTYQKISSTFINRYLILEGKINDNDDTSVTTQPIILVDLPAVIKHQALDEDFLTTFCIPNVNARNEICRCQKLTNKFINQHFDQLDVRKLLKYQIMDESTLQRCCERAVFYNPEMPKPSTTSIISGLSLIQSVNIVDIPTPGEVTDTTPILSQMTSPNLEEVVVETIETIPEESPKDTEHRYTYASLFVDHQIYSMELAQRVIDSFPNPKWREILWCNVFVRTLTPIGDDSYLGFSTDTIMSQVIPLINWDIIVTKTQLTDAQLDKVIEMASTLIPWYLYIKKHVLTESQIEGLNTAGVLDALTWWQLLTIKRKTPFSHTFTTKYEARKQWWNFINDPKEFYTSCLQALDNLDSIDVTGTNLPQIRSREDIRSFLTDFIAGTEWPQILHYEILPEWFIQLFGHARLHPKINLFWWNIGRWSTLTQTFIDRNITNLDLQIVLTHQIVTEEFLREKSPFFTPENWKTITERQNISNEFRITFAEQLTSC